MRAARSGDTQKGAGRSDHAGPEFVADPVGGFLRDPAGLPAGIETEKLCHILFAQFRVTGLDRGTGSTVRESVVTTSPGTGRPVRNHGYA